MNYAQKQKLAQLQDKLNEVLALININISEEVDHYKKQGKNYELQCDSCNKALHIEEISHFSGHLNGDKHTHIHVCTQCIQELDLLKYQVNITKELE